MDIGTKIKQLRVKKNMTQCALAKFCGVERKSISRLENNKVSPSMQTIKKISEVLEISPAIFFDD